MKAGMHYHARIFWLCYEKWRMIFRPVVIDLIFFFHCRPIPDRNRVFSITFGDCSIKFLEHVQVKVNLDFTRRGDLSLQLKAPSGTISPLTRKRVIDNLTGYKNLTNWVITTLFNWGESPIGKWELSVRDFDPKNPSTGKFYVFSEKKRIPN